MIAAESSNRKQIRERLRGPFANKLRSAGILRPHNDFVSEGGKLWPRAAPNSQPDLDQLHKEAIMYSKNSPQRHPTGAKLRRLVAISVSSLVLLAVGAASAQTGTSPVVYEFGRPARADEHTYDWYRRTHAEAASALYGIPADVIGDGMDT